MIVFPNAKINIGLYVTERREDGYHNLESVFLPLPIYDALEITPAANEASSLIVQGKLSEEQKEDNLVWKAYQLLKADYEQQIHLIDIHLNKAIPMGAGLGGGSSDGTFMLRLLNDYFGLGLQPQKLATYALALGSDCPFFVFNTPQLAMGRGEILSNIDLHIDWRLYKILCVHPPLHISTKEAFAHLTPQAPNFDLVHLPSLPISEWKGQIKNDFEKSFLSVHPEMQIIKDELYQQGAIYVSLTGTGSTFYAIFPSEKSVVLTAPILKYPITWCENLTIKN